jgi:hypothetical protein
MQEAPDRGRAPPAHRVIVETVMGDNMRLTTILSVMAVAVTMVMLVAAAA